MSSRHLQDMSSRRLQDIPSRHTFKTSSRRFQDQQMFAGLLLSKNESSEIRLGDSIIEGSTREKLLCIKIDSKLRFDDHIQYLCNKATRK